MQRTIGFYILLLCSLIPVAAAIRLDHGLLGDDPLITLTYAKNIAAGNGFIFNHGVPVLGTTTPLFALFVAAFMALLPGVAGTAIAVWTTALCWIGTIWSFYFFREAFGISTATSVWIGAVIAANGWVGHLGMEAYPFALLSVATAGAVYGRRFLLAGLLGGLLFLTRGEGILFFGLVALAGWWSHSRRKPENPASLFSSPPVAMALGFLIPLGLWSAYATLTFGNIFPNTLAAKIAQVESGLWPAFQTRLVADWIPHWALGPSLGSPLLNIFYVLVAAGLVRAATRCPRLLVFPAWALVYISGYMLLGVPGYPWYRLPIEFVLLVCVALGLEALTELAGARHEVAWRRRVAWVPGLAIVAAISLTSIDAIRHPPVHEKDRAYRELAHWFAENGRPGERVAYHEIGYLGYYTDLGIVDLVGLVTPEITPRVAVRDFVSGFWEMEPDYLVSLENSAFILPILRNPEFGRGYRKVAEFDGFDGLGLTVFMRKPDS